MNEPPPPAPVPEPVRLYEAVYDLLVAFAGARDDERERSTFAAACADGCHEYRFMGSLGFGGKFWSDRFEVNCYREDETPERLAAIARTNAALARLRAATVSAPAFASLVALVGECRPYVAERTFGYEGTSVSCVLLLARLDLALRGLRGEAGG